MAWFVVIHTSDCRLIVYQISTNRDNADGLVATFETGPYEFKLGAVYKSRAKDTTLLDHAAVAKDSNALNNGERYFSATSGSQVTLISPGNSRGGWLPSLI